MLRDIIYRNIIWLILDKVVRLIGGLIVAVWVARYLGPKDYGILNYGLVFTALFSLLVNFGLDRIVVREVVKDREKLNVYLGTAFIIKMCGACIAITLIGVTAYYFETDSIVKFTIFLISIGFIFQSMDVIDFYYQALMQQRYIVYARTFSFIIASFLKIYFIVSEFPVLYFAFTVTFEILLSSAFLLVMYVMTGQQPLKWRFNKKIALQYFYDCWPLAINMFLGSIHMRIDQAMIKIMLDIEKLGIFSIAVKIAEYWYFIPAILIQVLMPYFIQLREVNYELYENRLMQLYSIMFWIGVLVGVFTLMAGDKFIELFFGIAYIDAYKSLVINIWKGVFIAQSIARSMWLINENIQRDILIPNSLAVLTNIILNFFFITYLDITGAALSSLISIILSTWILSLMVGSLRKSTLSMIKSISPKYIFIRSMVKA